MWPLFLVWTRVGAFGFGGGPSFIPLVRSECVDRQHWMDDAEFLDALALGNALPGPISIKLAAVIGWKVAGWGGLLLSLFGVTWPGVLLMMLLWGFYHRFRDNPAVEAMMRGVRPAVVGLLAWTAWSLAPDGIRDWRAGLLAGVAFFALWARVHPAIVIAAAGAVGVQFFRG